VFLGVSAYWERAIQGAVILSAVAADAWQGSRPAALIPRMARQ
jgi:ribose/xylose/arabinose/galactoside ABC-type transport system permease subunit